MVGRGPASGRGDWPGWFSWPPDSYLQAWLVATGTAVIVLGLVFLVLLAQGIWPGWPYYWVEFGVGLPLINGLAFSCAANRRRRQAERVMTILIDDGHM
jgi:hypothetical protein